MPYPPRAADPKTPRCMTCHKTTVRAGEAYAEAPDAGYGIASVIYQCTCCGGRQAEPQKWDRLFDFGKMASKNGVHQNGRAKR